MSEHPRGLRMLICADRQEAEWYRDDSSLYVVCATEHPLKEGMRISSVAVTPEAFRIGNPHIIGEHIQVAQRSMLMFHTQERS
ncbi:hypothetical protein MUN77_01700 [Leucobacter allii]|uniref:hypothetical protein n=1 Tax=Leucobacter allii TaxID=2932247 RepID=UPI001FD5B72D|nr:hypothetical protein [Leucobacter allii]UOR02074.1 hypothetical protein MUN77_01700 [Leucobacter allii]